MNIDIYIDKKGTASVIETWNATLNSGATEGYKQYYTLGDSSILNYKVSMILFNLFEI